MAIQFQCPACGQPIEVDDEWARQAVACPYCQKTVTAPDSSTFETGAAVGTAKPLAPPGVFGGVTPARRGGMLGAVALLLAISAVSSALVCGFMLAAKLPPSVAEAMDRGDREAATKFLADFLESGEAAGLMLGVVAAVLAWAAGVICGLIAVGRRPRPWTAVIALLVSLVLPGMMLISALAGGAT